ncbi:MAG: dihydroorotase, partial [Candidatus Marinimicrobia bacterium]|nr:dihydroorotase [Candidatus Neomarinimicrobiota bacterium]
MKVNKLDSKVLLKNGTIIDPLKESQSKADILLVEGKIAEIGKIQELDVITTVDCSGLILT